MLDDASFGRKEAVFRKEFVLCFLVVCYIYGAFVILDVNKSTISIDTFIFGAKLTDTNRSNTIKNYSTLFTIS